MFNWFGLPDNVQEKCISKMSLVTRARLRMTCVNNQVLEYCTPLEIPRIRWHEKAGRFLLVIYTGVGKFLRLEFRPENKGCVIYRSENNFQLVRKKTVEDTPFEVVTNSLRSITRIYFTECFSTELNEPIPHFTTLGALEISSNRRCQLNKMTMHISDFEFKAYFYPENFDQPHLYTLDIFWRPETEVYVICGNTDKEFLQTETLLPSLVEHSIGNRFPDIAQLYLFYGKPCLESYYRTKIAQREFQKNWTLRYGPEIVPEVASELGDVEPRKVDGLYTIKSGKDSDTTINVSKCGIWTEHQKSKRRHRFQPEIKNNCGLGFFCKTHSDPFDFWYYSNIPRRLIDEPFWADHILVGPGEDFGDQDLPRKEIAMFRETPANGKDLSESATKEQHPKFTVLEVVASEPDDLGDRHVLPLAGAMVTAFVLGVVCLLIFL